MKMCYNEYMGTGQVLKTPQVVKVLRKLVVDEHALSRAARGFAKAYHVSLSDVLIMIRQQGGKCVICHRRPVLVTDFVGGKLAGFLCLQCNTGLNRLGRSVEILKSAISYIETTKLDHSGAVVYNKE